MFDKKLQFYENKKQIMMKYKLLLKIYVNIYHKLGTVLYLIKKYFSKFGIIHRGEYKRAIGNAMRHGRCPLYINLYKIDKKEYLLSIEDSGSGFDYIDIINKYENKQPYAKHHGLGTRTLMCSRNVRVNWDKSGKRILLKYKGSNSYESSTKTKKYKFQSDTECQCNRCRSLQRRHAKIQDTE